MLTGSVGYLNRNAAIEIMGNSANTATLRERFAALALPSDTSLAELLMLPTSLQDVFDALKTEDVESLVTRETQSLLAFLGKAVGVLRRPFQSSSAASQSLEKLNCLRFLTRIMPVLLRHGKEPEISEILWGEERHMAAEIVEALVAVAVMKGFTVAEGGASEEDEVALIWYPGLVLQRGETATYGIEENQTELLRSVLACCSETIYETMDDISTHFNPWIALFASQALPHSQTFCYSLLNAVTGFRPDGGIVPILTFGIISQEVAMLSAQLVFLFLHTPQSAEGEERTDERVTRSLAYLGKKRGVEANDSDALNVFAATVHSLSEEDSLALVCRAFTRLLSHRRDLGLEEEILLVTWEVFQHNPALVRYFGRQPEAKSLYKHLIYMMWTCIEDQSLAGPLQVSCFVLLLLSTDRNFCLQLAGTDVGEIGVSLPQGVSNLFDVLVILAHKLAHVGNNSSLVSILLTVISNAANFVKRIGALASVELISLFKLYSSHKSLTSDVTHLQIVRSILETITTRVQYYWQGSAHLVYAVMMRKEIFTRFLDAQAEMESEGVQLEQWFRRLPLDSLKVLISYFDPRVEQLSKRLSQVTDSDFLSLFANSTLVGLFPVPSPVYLQSYHPNAVTFSWMLSYAWAVIYMKHQHIPLFDYVSIRLFGINPPSN